MESGDNEGMQMTGEGIYYYNFFSFCNNKITVVLFGFLCYSGSDFSFITCNIITEDFPVGRLVVTQDTI